MKVSKAVIGASGGALLIGAIAGAALLYANLGGNDKGAPPEPQVAGELVRFAEGSLARLEVPRDPPPTPAHAFRKPDGTSAALSDFAGRVAVINVWAMWCAPCRTEMPTLARLAETYAGSDLIVVPVNVDSSPEAADRAEAFLAEHQPLEFYTDPRFQLPFELPGKGKMPQTVLLDRQGRIRAHLSGEADWSGPEARALVDALLAEPTGG